MSDKDEQTEDLWLADPEIKDDSAYMEELFEYYKATGAKPEDFVDPEWAAQYREWLKTRGE
jgi:hypothetical protein